MEFYKAKRVFKKLNRKIKMNLKHFVLNAEDFMELVFINLLHKKVMVKRNLKMEAI